VGLLYLCNDYMAEEYTENKTIIYENRLKTHRTNMSSETRQAVNLVCFVVKSCLMEA
jgi:hypothetical protein